MGFLSTNKPIQVGPPTAKQKLEEELRVAYGHRDKLQKVNTRVDGSLATYVLAYWTVKDRISRLEKQYQELPDDG